MALQKCDHKRGGAASAEALMGQFRRFCGGNLHLPESGAAQAIARTEGDCLNSLWLFILFDFNVQVDGEPCEHVLEARRKCDSA